MKLNTLGLLLIILALFQTSCSSQTEEIDKIIVLNPAAFSQKLNTTERAQLIDVRTPAEYNEGNIPNAQNINIQADDFLERVRTLNKEEPIYVYCKAGGRSAKAAKILEKEGFTLIYDLRGGYTSWVSSKK